MHFFAGEKRYDFGMAKFKQLRDLYQFPGFVPSPRIRGLFGDPIAVVIRLHRRPKKRCAGFVVRFLSPATTNDPDGSVTCPRGINVSTDRFRFGGYSVRGVWP